MCIVLTMAACSTPAGKINGIRLGMTPDDVRKQMGNKYTVRAAKQYADGQTEEVWEFLTTGISLNPKDYRVSFINGKVVQWGEPGDFAGGSSMNAPVEAYKPERTEH